MPMKKIDNLCRICVQESRNYKHIYDLYILDIRLFEIINDLCQLNVYVGDGLPKYICPCCHSKLLEFYKFKQTSHEGKAALLSIKTKLEKMAADKATRVPRSQPVPVPDADDWTNRQLPVESIGQLLEVHIKEEPEEDETTPGPQDYSIEGSREAGGYSEQVQLMEEQETSKEPQDYSMGEGSREAGGHSYRSEQIFVKCEPPDAGYEIEATPQSTVEPCNDVGSFGPQVLLKIEHVSGNYLGDAAGGGTTPLLPPGFEPGQFQSEVPRSKQRQGSRVASCVLPSEEGDNVPSCGRDGDKTVNANKFLNSNFTVKARKKCRKCFVPYCKNTTSGNAEKGFVNVPLHRERRIAWFKAARREISGMPSYELYCCGDHFNLREDTENYMYHKTMGVSLRVKKDVLPHIFECQPERFMCQERLQQAEEPLSDGGHSIFGEGMPSSSAYKT